jgi:hypothetical protein
MADLALKFQDLSADFAGESRCLLDDHRLSKYHMRFYNPYGTRDWVMLNVHDNRRKAQLLDAIHCFFDVAVRSDFSTADLAPLKLISESKIRGDRNIGMQLLIPLGRYHSAVRDVLFELLGAPKAEIRLTMISHFGFFHLPYPKEFVLNVVARGLKDASAKVRINAGGVCYGYYEEKDSLPLLEDRLRRETNQRVKDELLFDIAIVRDGFQLRSNDKNQFSLSVRTIEGLTSVVVQKEHTTAENLGKVVELVRTGKFDGSSYSVF